jgi:hypothetical protein
MAKAMKFLAIYLETISKRQGYSSMKTVFQTPNQLMLVPPRRSADLDALIQQRQATIDQPQPAVPANDQDDGDGAGQQDGTSDDDGFDFHV